MGMMTMINFFSITELVPEHIFKQRGQRAWELFDYRALLTLEWLRANLGKCMVNDWKVGGQYSQSGLRTFEFYMQDGKTSAAVAHKKISESLSQHKFGRAFDCKFEDYTAEQARQFIKDNWESSGFDWAITLEEGVNWLHFDTRLQKENKVYTFSV
jgi:hypothetical protein